MHVVFALIWNLQKGWSSLRRKFIRGGSPVSTSSCFPAADLHRAAGFDLFGASIKRPRMRAWALDSLSVSSLSLFDAAPIILHFLSLMIAVRGVSSILQQSSSSNDCSSLAAIHFNSKPIL